MRGELCQEQHAVVWSNGVVTRAIERRGHELGPHLAIALIERGIRHPGRRHQVKFRDGTSEDAHAIPAHPGGAAYKATREAVIAKAGVAARGLHRFEVMRRPRDLKLKARRLRLADGFPGIPHYQ